MKKTFTLILALVASFMMSSRMYADGEHTIEMNAEPGAWASVTEWFDANTIGSELGIDGTALFSAIDTWYNAGYASDFYTLKTADGGWSYERGNAGDGAFYITSDGVMQEGYGSAAAYVRLDYDEDSNEIGITIGQTPSCGECEINCTVSLYYKGQRVIFTTKCTVATPTIDKDPVTTIADLNIVGRTNFEYLQAPESSDWNSDWVEIPLTGICEKLDIDPAYMAEKISPMLFAKSFDSETATWSTTLFHEFTADAPGFWFNTGVYDEETQTESAELTAGSFNWDDSNKFYASYVEFNDSSETLGFWLGQYPGSWSLNEEHTADLYLVYGDKAWVITIDLTVGVDASKTISNYNKLGGTELSLQRNPRGGWDELDALPLDMASILAKFPEGTTADQLELYSEDANGVLTNTYTADAPGFWFDADGGVISYGGASKSFYIDLASDTLWIGNMPDAFDGGEECVPAKLYFISGENYYEVDVTLTMDKPSYTLADCSIVEKSITIEQIPSSNWQTGTTDASFLENIIGTGNGKFYGVNEAGEPTDKYSVSEATSYGGGGFWMSPKDDNNYAYASGYSSTGAFAIWYYEGEFNWYNYPGLPQVGEYVTATFYVANLWEGKAVKLNLTLKWVDEIFEIDTEGEEDIEVAMCSEDGKSYAVTPVDLSACIEALGTDAEEFANNGDWFVVTPDNETTYDGMMENYGYMLNEDGRSVTDESQAKFTVGYFDDGFHSYIFDQENAKEYTTTIYATINEKNYAFNVTVKPCSTAINSVVPAAAKAGKTYDLNGRQIAAPSRQVIIRDGKKVYVK